MTGLAGLGLKAVEGSGEDRNKQWVSSKTQHLFITRPTKNKKDLSTLK
jgi:hypothetical protein